MLIRKLIRLLLKIPATAFVVPWHLLLLSIWYGVKIFEWIYEAGEWDKIITQDLITDSKKELKKWFTTI
jgi:hypothetical protein